MMKAALTKEDGTPVIVLGLSHRNLWGLKHTGPIVVELSGLGHRGKVAITSVKGDTIAAPKVKDLAVFSLTDNTLESLKNNHTILVKMASSTYTGEILIFSAKDEKTMEEMFSDFKKGKVLGGACVKCRAGFREDGSCDCKETMT